MDVDVGIKNVMSFYTKCVNIDIIMRRREL